MKKITNLYYKRSHLLYFLLPISWIYFLAITLRKWFYSKGLLASKQFSVPIIVVGNITLGGTGKTPLVIYLVELLKKHGYKPGVVSRGYLGNATKYFRNSTNYPITITNNSDPKLTGDEPLLIFQRTDVPVVIDPKRIRAVQFLLDNNDCNVIISDDGLQHYALKRDIEIVVVDGGDESERGFGNGLLLPAGPLRESTDRLKTVDFIVCNSGSIGIKKFNVQQMQFHPMRFVNLKNPELKCDATEFNSEFNSGSNLGFNQKKIIAVAGIGNPERFFSTLKSLGLHFLKHPLPDHYSFTADDFGSHTENSQTTDLFIMTEKDAVKCKSFATSNMWYLPIEAKLTTDFDKAIIERVERFL